MAFAAVLAAVPSGHYVNAFEAMAVLVVLLIWARLWVWADKDAPEVHLPRESINIGMLAGILIGLAVFFLLPVSFWIAYPLFLLIVGAEVGAYLSMRNKKAGLKDLQEQFDRWRAGNKKKGPEAEAPPGLVQVIGKGGAMLAPPGAEDPDRPAYDATQWLLTEPLRRNAERVDLTASPDGAAVTYAVDGVRYEGQPMDRGSGSAAVTYLKTAAGLDVAEKRKPQTGTFKTTIDGTKRDVQITTKGSSVGESLSLIAEPKKRHPFTVDTLGFSPEQLKVVQECIADGKGVVLLAAPPGQGLTSLEYGMLRGHDAFVQLLMTLERGVDQDLEGVTQNALLPNVTPAEELGQIQWIISQEPDVILLGAVEDATVARDLIRFGEERRAYLGLRAGNTFEALRQWRKVVADDNLAMKNLKLIIAGRPIRKLCEACKIAYTPDPTLLKKLNMDPKVVTQLNQARTTPMRDDKGVVVPCTFCMDLAFKGRTGVYEVLRIDDEVRKVVMSNGSENQLKAAFRNQKGRYLQELALALVESGQTSVNEVQRVLRPAGEAPAVSRSAPPEAVVKK